MTDPLSAPAEAVSLARAIDATGADLYGELRGAVASTVFSPASIAVALHMALRGARGETAAELARFLHVPEKDAGAGLRTLSAELAVAATAGDVTFRMPTTMWVQSGLSLEPEFAAWLQDVATVDARDVDFTHAPGKAHEEINRVIAEQTADKIRNLIPPGIINAFTRLVLTNAVYLKAAWAHPFPADATRPAPFHLADGGTVTVPMMRETALFGYIRADGYQAAVLPYAGGRLAMAVILPDGSLASLGGRLAAAGAVHGMLTGVRNTRVRLALPRFRFEAQFQLADTLRRLGVQTAFSPGADFSGISGADQLFIAEVLHKAFIDVDEKGTEAAAATAAVIRMVSAMLPPPPAVTMTVDRPFLFAIIETRTGVPLFLGTQTNPAGG